MGTRTESRDATGKVTITEETGLRETRFSPVADCKTYNDFTQVWETPVGEFSEGQVEVSASVRGDAGAEWTALEVRIVGYLGPISNVLWIGMIGGAKTTARTPLVQGDAYDRIAIEARPIVNGTPGPGAFTPLEASVCAGLKLWG